MSQYRPLSHHLRNLSRAHEGKAIIAEGECRLEDAQRHRERAAKFAALADEEESSQPQSPERTSFRTGDDNFP